MKTNKELAQNLRVVSHMIEWDYPINYAGDLYEAADRLQNEEERCSKYIYDRPNHWYCEHCKTTVGRLALLYKYCYECGYKIENVQLPIRKR